MSGLERTVENMNTNINAPRDDTIAGEFFETYTRALLDRDAAAIAAHYAVPSLIEFPDQRIVVFEAAQTENFFRTAFEQYEGITRADADIDVVEKTGHSVWAAVSLRHLAGSDRRRSRDRIRSRIACNDAAVRSTRRVREFPGSRGA